MKYTHAAAVLLLCAALAPTTSGSQGGSQSPRSRSKPAQTKPASKPAASKPAAERPLVRELDEGGLKALLDENRQAGRRLLVNFWATWCTPCREEFPDLVRIQEEFGARADFRFVTVSLDDPTELAKAVPEFLAETGAAGMPAYLLNAKDQEVAIRLIDQGWFGDLPATFLFSPDGTLLFRHTGRVKPDELRKAINDSTRQK